MKVNGATWRPCICCARNEWDTRFPGFFICRHCGVMTLDWDETPEKVKVLYSEEYFHGREYVDYVADRSAIWKTLGQHLKILQRHVPPGGRVLEVGCAYGFFLEMIREIYPGSVGVDVAAKAVANAVSRGLDAREGDVRQLELDGCFDAVCLWDTIEHLAAPHEVLMRCRDLLKPNGCLLLSTGDFGSLLARAQGLNWRQIHPPSHLFYFTRRSLRALCERLGFEMVRFDTVRVYRRLHSALLALDRFHHDSISGRAASWMLRILPSQVLDFDVPLNLGDTLRLVARRATHRQFPAA